MKQPRLRDGFVLDLAKSIHEAVAERFDLGGEEFSLSRCEAIVTRTLEHLAPPETPPLGDFPDTAFRRRVDARARQVVKMRDEEGMTFKAIAEALDYRDHNGPSHAYKKYKARLRAAGVD